MGIRGHSGSEASGRQIHDVFDAAADRTQSRRMSPGVHAVRLQDAPAQRHPASQAREDQVKHPYRREAGSCQPRERTSGVLAGQPAMPPFETPQARGRQAPTETGEPDYLLRPVLRRAPPSSPRHIKEPVGIQRDRLINRQDVPVQPTPREPTSQQSLPHHTTGPFRTLKP